MLWAYSPALPAAALAQGLTYTLTADAGVFTLSGQGVGLAVQSRLAADAGVFTLSGQDAAFIVTSPAVYRVVCLVAQHALAAPIVDAASVRAPITSDIRLAAPLEDL